MHTMLTPEKIRELQAQAHEAIASEMYDNQPTITNLDWLIRQMPAWTRWYLKKNQPRNYIRVTRLIPPGSEENHHRWIQKLQVWAKDKLVEEYDIDAATFDHFAALWGVEHKPDISYAIYRSPNQLSAIANGT